MTNFISSNDQKISCEILLSTAITIDIYGIIWVSTQQSLQNFRQSQTQTSLLQRLARKMKFCL